MKILLDTHVFLWFIAAPERLAGALDERLHDPDNERYLSAVSTWEICVKHSLGKLPLPEPPSPYIAHARRQHGILELPLTEAAVLRLEQLPSLHRDPFDRMLICQALESDLTFATVDQQLRTYPVATL